VNENYLISVTVELDPAEYAAEDIPYHRQLVKRAVEEQCPGASVRVRSGRYLWCDSNDSWSRAV
jgi:hypothetical protein